MTLYKTKSIRNLKSNKHVNNETRRLMKLHKLNAEMRYFHVCGLRQPRSPRTKNGRAPHASERIALIHFRQDKAGTMKYAVIFKVWRWDSAVENNFRLCRNFSAGADFFILYDRTSGMDDIPENIRSEERIFFISSEDATDLGLSGSHEGGVNLFWYNADYQHSLFCLKYPDYDFMCFVESDVAVFTSLHAILKKMSKQCVDVIFQTPDTACGIVEPCRQLRRLLQSGNLH